MAKSKKKPDFNQTAKNIVDLSTKDNKDTAFTLPGMSFEKALKKALNTPLPKKSKK